MGYLYCLLAVAAWTGLAFSYRLGERLRADRFTMVAAMGGAGVALDLLMAAAWGADLRSAHPSQFLIGSVLGLCAVVNIPAFLAALARGDLSITWTVLTLSFAPTAVLCILYPGEKPSVTGIMVLVLAAAAVVLLGVDMSRRRSSAPVATGPKRRAGRGWGFFMVVAFLTNLASLYTFRLASHFAPDDRLVHKLAFLGTAYAVFAVSAGVLSAAGLRTGSVAGGLKTGTLAGSLMFVGGLSAALALSHAVPGHIMFPVTNGGSNVLVVTLSVLLLRERPSACGWLGIAAGLGALVMTGLKM